MDPLAVWEDMMALLMQCDVLEAAKRAGYLRTWLLDGGFVPGKLIPKDGDSIAARRFLLAVCTTIRLGACKYKEFDNGEDA